MNSFTTWVLRGLSETQGKSRLSQISDLIDWLPIRRILDEMYDNKSEKGGRPNCDVIYRSNMERSKMPRSLKQIPESSRNHVEKMLRPAAVGMGQYPRRAMNSILATNCIKKPILTIA